MPLPIGFKKNAFPHLQVLRRRLKIYFLTEKKLMWMHDWVYGTKMSSTELITEMWNSLIPYLSQGARNRVRHRINPKKCMQSNRHFWRGKLLAHNISFRPQNNWSAKLSHSSAQMGQFGPFGLVGQFGRLGPLQGRTQGGEDPLGTWKTLYFQGFFR